MRRGDRPRSGIRRLARWIARGLGALLVVVLFAVFAAGGLLWLSMPGRTPSRLAIPGLKAPVEITYDSNGIPWIHAQSALDAATALGWVHARARMFQMDLMRRAASGRLSELFGPPTLSMDELNRTLGLRRRAVADYAALPPGTQAMLQAYARGVNAWIGARGRFSAPEFLVFGAPEPWTPVDCLLWGKTMGMWLSYNWRTELARLSLVGKLPVDRILQLWPPDGGAGHPDALNRTDVRYADAASVLLRVLPHFPQPFTLPRRASDEWAVDGSHTATGAPLLAGDPHLAYGFPSIWYLARIDTPEGTLAGATAPGIPFLVLGRNSHIAWTFTTTGADTQDVFEETALPDGRYQTPDGPQPFALHEERIKVRGEPDTVITVRETRHGPVISDLDGKKGGPVLAVAMANLQPGDTAAAGLLALNQATDVAEAGKAAAEISAPVQNLLVADQKQIALFMTGRIPVRRSGDGSMPVPGADGLHDWVGWASGDQLPHIVQPASGRLVNGNERVAPPDFPVFLGRDWFGDWRAQRIRELLSHSDRHTPADFAAMQIDSTSSFAQQILPALRNLPIPAGLAASAVALLRDWNGEMRTDQPQPLIFNAWVQRFYMDMLAKAGVPAATGPAVAPWAEFAAYALTPAGAHWCDGDCAALLVQALQEAVAELSRRFGPDPAKWRWGAVHQAIFAHPVLGRMPVLGPMTTARIETPGDDTTLFRGGAVPGNFAALHGPEYRGVYDLADLDRSLFMMAPGQSGNPFGRHAHDMLARWRDGKTVSLGAKPGQVASVVQLSP